jgi:hypothetical protein
MKYLMMNILNMTENQHQEEMIPDYEIIESIIMLMHPAAATLFACDCAEHVRHIWDTEMTRYTSVASLCGDAIEASRKYFHDARSSVDLDRIRKSIDNYVDANKSETKGRWAVLAARNAAGITVKHYAQAAFCAYMAAESGQEERKWQLKKLREYVGEMQD